MNKEEMKASLIEVLRDFIDTEPGKKLAYHGQYSLHDLLSFLEGKSDD